MEGTAEGLWKNSAARKNFSAARSFFSAARSLFQVASGFPLTKYYTGGKDSRNFLSCNQKSSMSRKNKRPTPKSLLGRPLYETSVIVVSVFGFYVRLAGGKYPGDRKLKSAYLLKLHYGEAVCLAGCKGVGWWRNADL